MGKHRINDDGHLRWFDSDDEYYAYLRNRSQFKTAEEYNEYERLRAQFNTDEEYNEFIREKNCQEAEDLLEQKRQKKLDLWWKICLALWAILSFAIVAYQIKIFHINEMKGVWWIVGFDFAFVGAFCFILWKKIGEKIYKNNK